MIYRKDEFVQDDLNDREFPIKQVDRLEAIDGSLQRFIGRAALNMHTPLGVQQIPVSFEIEAKTIEEAFAAYTEAARVKIEEVREHVQRQLDEIREAERSRIVTPGEAAPPDDILRMDDFRRGR